jgi:hypothetical protein
MKHKNKIFLTIEANNKSERLEGKRFYSLSSKDPSSDVFVDTNCGLVDLKIIVLYKSILLINRGDYSVRANGMNPFKGVYFSSGVMTVFFENCPVILSVHEEPTFFSSEKIPEKVLLFTAALCLVASFYFSSTLTGIKEITPAPQIASVKFSTTKVDTPPSIESISYSQLNELLISIERADKEKLKKTRRALLLSKKIYENGGEEANSSFIGRIIGGLNRHLHDNKI